MRVPTFVLTTVLASATVLSPHAARAQQEQTFAEANDIVLSTIASCAQQVVAANGPGTPAPVLDGTNVGFWGCIYADGWPGVDVPDYRLDRPMRVVQSTLDDFSDLIMLTVTLGFEAGAHPDEVNLAVQWFGCLGWALVQANAYASMSEQGRAENPGLAPRRWACGQEPRFTDAGSFELQKMLPPGLRRIHPAHP